MKTSILLMASALYLNVSLAQSSDTDTTQATAERRGWWSQQNGNNQQPVFNNQGNFYGQQNQAFRRRISDRDFAAELRRIKFQTGNTARRTAARRLLNTFSLTANQISDLSNSMFGQARLDIAKYGYTRCFDPYNYSVVLNSLNPSLADELMDFITYVDDGAAINGFAGSNTPDHPFNNPYYPGFNNVRTMSDQDFANAKRTISGASFDNTKLETAKSIVSNNLMTAAQVAEICCLFDFEATKLNFAKYAFNYTFDKNNYFIVSNVFDFDASRLDLNRFIQRG